MILILNVKARKQRFAWGITGSGHEMVDIFNIVKYFSIKNRDIDIRAFVSNSGHYVLSKYNLDAELEKTFKVKIESSPNIPFLAGELQSKKYDFLLVAPTSSNSTAKIALGIGDTLITNSVNMAVKAKVPVYVYPCEVFPQVTLLPDGERLELIQRKIDRKHIDAIEKDEGIQVIHRKEEIAEILNSHY